MIPDDVWQQLVEEETIRDIGLPITSSFSSSGNSEMQTETPRPACQFFNEIFMAETKYLYNSGKVLIIASIVSCSHPNSPVTTRPRLLKIGETILCSIQDLNHQRSRAGKNATAPFRMFYPLKLAASRTPDDEQLGRAMSTLGSWARTNGLSLPDWTGYIENNSS